MLKLTPPSPSSTGFTMPAINIGRSAMVEGSRLTGGNKVEVNRCMVAFLMRVQILDEVSSLPELAGQCASREGQLLPLQLPSDCPVAQE